MSMRSLDLDFLQRGRRPGCASWTLLAVAVAFALDLGGTWMTLNDEIERKTAQLNARAGEMQRPNVIRVATQPVPEGELSAARDTLRRLAVPWNSLFRALEAAQTDRAWLLTVEPEAQNGTVTLTGEARDYLAALSYVANLEQQPSLSRVHLARHETRQNDPQRPLAFTVSASWKERP
jgi:hypothetical protein